MKVTWPAAREIAGLLACLCIGLVLRLLAIDEETAWGDETLTALCLPADGFRAYQACAFERDPTIRLAPLYHCVQYGWSWVFGGTLPSLRMLSVSLSVIAMVQIYALVRRMASPPAARWAVILFGLSLFQIYYGQEVRVYALLCVLSLAAAHALRAYVQDGWACGMWVALIANGALLLTHSFMVLFVVAQGLYVVLCARGRALRWTAAHAGLAAVFAGWIFYIGYDVGSESQAFRDRASGWRELAATGLQFTGGRFSNYNPGDYLLGGINLEIGILVLTAALVALPVMGAAGRLQPAGETRPLRGDVFFLVSWLAVPVVLLFVINRLWAPCFFARYLIYCALPVSMLAAMGLVALRPAILRRAIATALAGMLLWQNLALPRPFRADYGAVTRAVGSDEAPKRTVLALKRFNHLAVVYALREVDVDVKLHYGVREIIATARERASAGDSVWVVFYHWDNLERFETAMGAAGFETRSFESAGMPPLHLYQVQPGRAGVSTRLP